VPDATDLNARRQPARAEPRADVALLLDGQPLRGSRFPRSGDGAQVMSLRFSGSRPDRCCASLSSSPDAVPELEVGQKLPRPTTHSGWRELPVIDAATTLLRLSCGPCAAAAPLGAGLLGRERYSSDIPDEFCGCTRIASPGKGFRSIASPFGRRACVRRSLAARAVPPPPSWSRPAPARCAHRAPAPTRSPLALRTGCWSAPRIDQVTASMTASTLTLVRRMCVRVGPVPARAAGRLSGGRCAI